jgi:hypothetical protein
MIVLQRCAGRKADLLAEANLEARTAGSGTRALQGRRVGSPARSSRIRSLAILDAPQI